MTVPPGHRYTADRSAAFLYAKELIALVRELNKENKLPKLVVSSENLSKVPVGKIGLAPGEVVPLSARINDLESNVKKLCDSFEKFKCDNQTSSKANEITFANIAAGTHRSKAGQSSASSDIPRVQVRPPSHSDWSQEVENAAAQINAGNVSGHH